jgi:hypothetical protein
VFRRVADAAGYAWSLVHEGDCAREQRDEAAARTLYQDAMERFRAMADDWGIGTTLLALGHLACDRGVLPEAWRAYQDALDAYTRLDDPRGIARVLEALACMAAARNDAGRALKLAGAAAALRHVRQVPLVPSERATLERTLEPARRAPSVAASAWMDGWGMSFAEAMAYARDDSAGPAVTER